MNREATTIFGPLWYLVVCYVACGQQKRFRNVRLFGILALCT